MRQLPTNDLIREVLGEKHPIALGWQVLVETYKFGDNFVNEDGSKSVFERPDVAKERDRYQMGIGRVLMVGGAAFKGPKFTLWDVIPEVGDCVAFQKYEGVFISHVGIDAQYLQDYLILGIVPDPTLSGGYIRFVGN